VCWACLCVVVLVKAKVRGTEGRVTPVAALPPVAGYYLPMPRIFFDALVCVVLCRCGKLMISHTTFSSELSRAAAWGWIVVSSSCQLAPLRMD
jgi:hypothetical protein